MDFVSIGTNDLAQYTFAADRMQGELADLLDPWQPALLDLIAPVGAAGASGAAGATPVGVCGEAGGDPLLACVLAGLGVQSVLAAHTPARWADMADAAGAATDAEAARAAVRAMADDRSQRCSEPPGRIWENRPVLFQKRFWEPIQRGEVTLTFRRWRRSQVLAGRVYRTAAGRLEVTSVTTVGPEGITEADAVAAGYASASALLADLPGPPGDPVMRIAFRRLAEPDPRTVLANDGDLDPASLADLDRRLARLDRASSHGAWTLRYLEAIQAEPGRRAPDLAERFGRDPAPFKIDVRKLKNLGLTVSLPIGYRLSARGEAYLGYRRGAAG